MDNKHKYHIALSFAGENRNYVEQVNKCLKEKGVECFYDSDEEAYLWGKHLPETLDDIYKNQARFCVMFISRFYRDKEWTRQERRSALERASKQDTEYILPARFDDTDIPGLQSTIHYADLRKITPEKLCDLIQQKLNYGKTNQELMEPQPTTEKSLSFDIPKIKRKISDFEKNKFLKESFATVEKYFKEALKHLKESNPHAEAEFTQISNSKFVVEIFVDGESKSKCKIWIDTSIFGGGSGGISYLEGRNIDINSDNSVHDSTHISDDGIEIFFVLSGMGFGYTRWNFDPNHADPPAIAKYFWNRFIHYLN